MTAFSFFDICWHVENHQSGVTLAEVKDFLYDGNYYLKKALSAASFAFCCFKGIYFPLLFFFPIFCSFSLLSMTGTSGL